mmetsp:Transcript_150134/g.262252  ORF Transcript_150134/g.262252 Transcript_150134/m.262252 type:complete len:284 (+) Transcript_150134:264-1115(+)
MVDGQHALAAGEGDVRNHVMPAVPDRGTTSGAAKGEVVGAGASVTGTLHPLLFLRLGNLLLQVLRILGLLFLVPWLVVHRRGPVLGRAEGGHCEELRGLGAGAQAGVRRDDGGGKGAGLAARRGGRSGGGEGQRAPAPHVPVVHRVPAHPVLVIRQAAARVVPGVGPATAGEPCRQAAVESLLLLELPLCRHSLLLVDVHFRLQSLHLRLQRVGCSTELAQFQLQLPHYSWRLVLLLCSLVPVLALLQVFDQFSQLQDLRCHVLRLAFRLLLVGPQRQLLSLT